jgi:hypothetical protein
MEMHLNLYTSEFVHGDASEFVHGDADACAVHQKRPLKTRAYAKGEGSTKRAILRGV